MVLFWNIVLIFQSKSTCPALFLNQFCKNYFKQTMYSTKLTIKTTKKQNQLSHNRNCKIHKNTAQIHNPVWSNSSGNWLQVASTAFQRFPELLRKTASNQQQPKRTTPPKQKKSTKKERLSFYPQSLLFKFYYISLIHF